MSYTLKIGNFVQFPVSITVNDAGKDSTFKLKLTAKRINRNAMFEALGVEDLRDASDAAVREFLLSHVTGWEQDQALVMDEGTGQGAAFTPEAFGLVLGLWGALGVVFGAYTASLGVQDASQAKAARAKN